MFISGPNGKLECLLTLEEGHHAMAIICHPNPLEAGTMHNKVVTTLAKACAELGISTMRFNYRGVGHSEGQYGDVVGEIADAKSVYDYCMREYPGLDFYSMGFSFGAFIAAHLAQRYDTRALVTIAPGMVRSDFSQFSHMACPWLTVLAGADEVIDLNSCKDALSGLPKTALVETMDESSHFFHGRLVELRQLVVSFLKER